MPSENDDIDEFSGLLILDGRRVDMVTPKCLNARIRDQALSSGEPLYVVATCSVC
jgi:hypothetical protein